MIIPDVINMGPDDGANMFVPFLDRKGCIPFRNQLATFIEDFRLRIGQTAAAADETALSEQIAAFYRRKVMNLQSCRHDHFIVFKVREDGGATGSIGQGGDDAAVHRPPEVLVFPC